MPQLNKTWYSIVARPSVFREVWARSAPNQSEARMAVLNNML